MTPPQPPTSAGRALPSAGRPLPRGPEPVPVDDAPRFPAASPDAGVAPSVRRGRALGAAVAAVVAVAGAIAALALGAVEPAPVDEPHEPPPAWQAALDASLEEVVRPIDAPIVAAPVAPRRGPGPVDVTLPAGHGFTGWRLFCWQERALRETASGQLAAGERAIHVDLVPPADCRVSLVGEGAMSVPVTAGVRMTCTSPSRQSCRRAG